MELPLVVGVDGSQLSLRAVDWAADEAVRQQVPLRLVHGARWEHYESAAAGAKEQAVPAGERETAERIIATAVERAELRAPDLKVSFDVLPEDPVTALVHAGRNAFALVLGSRGRGGLAGMLLGSVSLSVAARADCPVIVIRGPAQGPDQQHRRIAVGVDDADTGYAALRFALREAAARDCPLAAVRAWRCPVTEYLDHPRLHPDASDVHEERARTLLDAALRATTTDPQVEVDRLWVEGTARRALLHAATTADLLVVGARRRPGHAGLGRTNHALLHHAPCPVAVVPQRP
ncbi:universal stress protein [Streptomyces sp. A7024]|uniref:Universal stress protein n=1 Tax=Streptomyces coryli TaxID=1128680 RepID=A0A6G4TR55_9ACTN|nr:universal stress protein [Streptomyces coryli]NGN62475.1 universal stress protein [Streptomyces coryli]